jgi:ParB-like chromosome segregation protein Spo0J
MPAAQKRAPLKVERVPIGTIQPHPDNKRRHTVERIEASLRAHGQFKPLVVQKSTRHVIAGNGTLQAAQNIGWTEIDVHFKDVDDDQAMRILLVDNKAGDDSGYDDRGLAEVLAQFGDDLDGTGWTTDEADELARITGLLAEQSGGFLDGFQGDTPEEVRRRAGEREYHQLQWPVTAQQRDSILGAIRIQRESMPERDGERPTSIEALVQLCEDFVERHDRKRAMRGDGE